ncbi:MAG: hypothetical protein FWG84_03010 [Bacteroidales bacterium]|nr:hypothetical protein [Bacteroidales bacterium]
MNRKRKKVFLIAGISLSIMASIAIELLVFISVRSFLGHVYSGRDCNYCNIDNIEVRVGINIPGIDDVDCIYDAEEDSKTVHFSVKLKKVDVEKYKEVIAAKYVKPSHSNI